MDKIYKRSKWTVAVLSKEVPDAMLSALALCPRNNNQHPKNMPFFENLPDGIDISPLYDDFKKSFDKILSSIVSDRWFTRAWTFQKRSCASTCVLLALVPNKSDAAAQLSLDWIGNDVSFSVRHMCMITRFPPTAPPLDAHDVHLILAEYLYCDEGLLGHLAHWLLFTSMERCDNLICSDRLTIYANVCGFRYKLDSTILNDVKYSYSTCMLALIMANEVKDELTADAPKIDMSNLNLDQNVGWYLDCKRLFRSRAR
jgi:hypothetical protein